MIQREKIKKSVPYGYANVTPKAVSEYLSGKTNSRRVANATVEVLEQLKSEQKEFDRRLMAAVS